MPFSGNTFTNVAGATTAVAGQTVQSAVWDNIHTDYATALTALMSQLTSQITNRNAIWMNGGFEVWQRGAGSSASIAVAATTTAYTADRWYVTTGANQASVISAQTGLVTPSSSCARIRRNAAQTGTTVYIFGYPLDSDEILRLRGSKVSFTCLVQAGANWSPASGTLSVALYSGTGAVAKRGGGFTNEVTVLSISTNLTAGGAVTTITGSSTIVLPATATQAELQFTWTPVGTAGAADDISIDDVQLEAQLSATTWTPTNYDRLDFPTMLQGCQRHYNKTFPYSVVASAGAGQVGQLEYMAAQITNQSAVLYVYPVRMRVTPGITTYNPGTGTANWQNNNTSADIAATIDPGGSKSDASAFIVAATVTNVGNFIGIQVTGSAGI